MSSAHLTPNVLAVHLLVLVFTNVLAFNSVVLSWYCIAHGVLLLVVRIVLLRLNLDIADGRLFLLKMASPVLGPLWWMVEVWRQRPAKSGRLK